MFYKSCEFCAGLFNILGAWMIINSVTFEEIIRCWPVGHTGSISSSCRDACGSCPCLCSTVIPLPTLQIPFHTVHRILRGISGFAHEIILLVSSGICVCSCERWVLWCLCTKGLQSLVTTLPWMLQCHLCVFDRQQHHRIAWVSVSWAVVLEAAVSGL